MKKAVLSLILCIACTSCASILNGDRTEVAVYMHKPAKVVYNADTLTSSLENETNTVLIDAKRNRIPLQLRIITDSVQKTVNVPSRNSLSYYGNFIYYGIGFLFDMNKSNRYTYPAVVKIDSNLNVKDNNFDESIGLKWKPAKSRYATHRNDVFMQLAPFCIQPGGSLLKADNQNRESLGSLFGLSAGFDYYYKNNRFVNLSTHWNFAGTLGPVFMDPYSDRSNANSYVTTLTDNHISGRFMYGYGLSYSIIDWRKTTFRKQEIPPLTRTTVDWGDWEGEPYTEIRQDGLYSTLGFAFRGYYLFDPNFTVGMTYNPSFIRLNASKGNTFCYEHSITFDFAFRFRLWKGKRQ